MSLKEKLLLFQYLEQAPAGLRLGCSRGHPCAVPALCSCLPQPGALKGGDRVKQHRKDLSGCSGGEPRQDFTPSLPEPAVSSLGLPPSMSGSSLQEFWDNSGWKGGLGSPSSSKLAKPQHLGSSAGISLASPSLP